MSWAALGVYKHFVSLRHTDEALAWAGWLLVGSQHPALLRTTPRAVSAHGPGASSSMSAHNISRCR